MSRGLVGAALLLGLLAGCQREEPPPPPPVPAPADAGATVAAGADAAPAPSPTAPVAAAPAEPVAGGAAGEGQTLGGDGSQIVLSPLSGAEVEAAELGGELACVFLEGDAPLLVARGDVASREPARGVVKVGDVVEMVAAPGGFDAMLRGTRFHGAGKTIEIVLTGPATGGGESPPRPARLAYDRGDGARREFAGRWECGP